MTVDTLKAEAFMAKNPNVTIKIHPQDNDTFRLTFPSAFASGQEDLDFSMMYLGAGAGQGFMSEDFLVDLTPYWEQYGWLDIIPQGDIDANSYDGKLFSVFTTTQGTPLVYYNPKIFEEVGIVPPTTMEELYTISDKLRDAGYIPWTLGANPSWPLFHVQFATLARTLGAEDYINFALSCQPGGDKEGSISWTDPRAVESFQVLKDMWDKKVFGDALFAMDHLGGQALFVSEEAAMVSSGAWDITVLEDQMKPKGIDIDYFLFPQVQADVPIFATGGAGGGYVVPAYVPTKYPEKMDAIIKFLDFLNSKEAAIIDLENGAMTSLTNMTEEELLPYLRPLQIKFLADLANGGVTPYPQLIEAGFNGAIEPLFADVVLGNKTAEEACQILEDTAAEIRAGYGE